MPETTRGAPTIDSIDPDRVSLEWEGIVAIHGDDFEEGSYALFSGKVPPTKFKSQNLLEASIDKAITAEAREITVKVHSPRGSVSNGVPFIVSTREE